MHPSQGHHVIGSDSCCKSRSQRDIIDNRIVFEVQYHCAVWRNRNFAVSDRQPLVRQLVVDDAALECGGQNKIIISGIVIAVPRCIHRNHVLSVLNGVEFGIASERRSGFRVGQVDLIVAFPGSDRQQASSQQIRRTVGNPRYRIIRKIIHNRSQRYCIIPEAGWRVMNLGFDHGNLIKG
ncbi:hypothetical protein D3C71_1456320 [compost metagenome]